MFKANTNLSILVILAFVIGIICFPLAAKAGMHPANDDCANSIPISDGDTAFDNACRRAKIKELRFHDLRQTAATRMIESGANIVAVSKILWHSTLSRTMRYSHPDESIREALENLAIDRSKNSSNKDMDNIN